MTNTEVTPVYASGYEHSERNTTLVSKDNIYFKVHDFYLKAHSTVFREMLDQSSSALRPSPIPIDAPSDDLRRFLDLMYKDKPANLTKLADCKCVLELCNKYDCTFIVERIRLRLRPMVSQAPWEIFCVASQLDDLFVAKAALAVMGKDTLHKAMTIHTITTSMASKPTLPYLLGLLQLFDREGLHCHIHGSTIQHCTAQPMNDWPGAADKFAPSK